MSIEYSVEVIFKNLAAIFCLISGLFDCVIQTRDVRA